jgi:uncharacterized membrane protein
MILRILHFVNVFLFVLVAGVFWGTWFSLSRSMSSITPQTFLEVGRIMIGNLALPMSILMPAAMVSALPVLFLLSRRRMKAAFFFEAASLLLFVGALVVTLTVNVPIDNEIKRWTAHTLPTDWQAIRDHWEFYHGLRTFASLAGLACAFASVFFTTAVSKGVESAR